MPELRWMPLVPELGSRHEGSRMSPTLARRMRRAALAGLAAFALASTPVMSTNISSAAERTGPGPLAGPPVKRACPDGGERARGQVTCLALVRTDVRPQHGIQPQRKLRGLGALDIRDAYRLPTGSGGRDATVAVINVFDDPKAEADLAVYRAQYGLPPCTTANGCFRKVNATGGATLPRADTGWSEEISLDLDMVSAACPLCHILLVESDQASISSLGTGVDTAVRLGARYISNSYGAAEDFVKNPDDARHFDHPGVAITAASGDSGYGVLFPAADSHVTAVGGTSLTRAANARGWYETAWSGSGSGCSSSAAKPPWQHDTGCPRRTVADVSAVADPATGVAVYDSYGLGGWLIVGGTSAATPIIAGAYALAGSLPWTGYAAASPYAQPQFLNDVVSGRTGTCTPAYLCTAGAGYDGPTGLGTPNGVAAFSAVRPGTLARPGTPPRRDTSATGSGGRPPAGSRPVSPPPPASARQAWYGVAAGAAPGTGSAPGRIADGGFESGILAGWRPSGPATTVTKDHPHSGTYAALLGDPDNPRKGDSAIRQSFVAARNDRRLSFWYDMTCRDREGVKYDWATASLRDETTGTTRVVLPKTCTYEDHWRQVTAPVIGGHVYTLTLVNHDDGYFGDPTSTKFDDVTLS
jgi:hypothetical protein